MMLVYKTRPEVRDLCAVNHVDNTGRLQTVSREQNARYYTLIEAFERETGLPVVLNTSFNENEPIVCTPAGGVLACFLRTRMDLLVMGNWMVRRPVPPLVGEQASEVHAGYAGDYLLEGGGR